MIKNNLIKNNLTENNLTENKKTVDKKGIDWTLAGDLSKIDFKTHFANRRRYDKDKNESWLERCLCKILIGGKTWTDWGLPEVSSSDKLAEVFMLGSTREQKNIVFIVIKNDNKRTMYFNRQLASRGRSLALAKWYYEASKCDDSQYMDGLPTGDFTRATSGGRTIDSFLSQAVETVL